MSLNPLPTNTIPEPFKLHELMTECKIRVESTLNQWLPPASTTPATLHQAMHYSTLAGGKYIRPLLAYATGKALGISLDTLDGPACAIELIHTYSLVHDDLPAMDDDDLRRGQASCHKKYDEATAILTGDALQSLAFHILAQDPAMLADPSQRLKMIDCLAIASGSEGMAGGQAIDLEAVGQIMELTTLESMHRLKTGALINASVRLAYLNLEALDLKIADNLDNYARYIGLAFQIKDDILDVESDTATLGKPHGADAAKNKPTYPALLGMQAAKQKASECYEQALNHIEALGKQADPLRCIAELIIQRTS